MKFVLPNYVIWNGHLLKKEHENYKAKNYATLLLKKKPVEKGNVEIHKNMIGGWFRSDVKEAIFVCQILQLKFLSKDSNF